VTDENIVLCMAKDELAPEAVIEGSIEVPCDQCGKLVCASPSSQQMLREGAVPRCFGCAGELNGLQPLTPEQKAELIGHIFKLGKN
jgi:hypothetical protein